MEMKVLCPRRPSVATDTPRQVTEHSLLGRQIRRNPGVILEGAGPGSLLLKICHMVQIRSYCRYFAPVNTGVALRE